jgi:hypothetical protein
MDSSKTVSLRSVGDECCLSAVRGSGNRHGHASAGVGCRQVSEDRFMTPMRHLFGSIASALLAGAASLAWSEGSALQLKDFREDFRSMVPVGQTKVVRGAFLGSSTQRADLQALSILLPSDLRVSSLCAAFTTRDGQYEGYARYDLSGARPGRHALVVPSKHLSELRRYNADSLAVLIVPADSCGPLGIPALSDQTTIIPVIWNNGVEPRQAILLAQLSTARGEIEVTQTKARSECKRLPDDELAPIAFDAQCAMTTWQTGVTAMIVHRFAFERELPIVDLRLHLP